MIWSILRLFIILHKMRVSISNPPPLFISSKNRGVAIMKYNPNIHHRRSIRIKEYDYSQAGAYFVTICIQDRINLLGKIVNDVMVLNDAGKMVNKQWLELSLRYTSIKLDNFVIMPNHFHGIIIIDQPISLSKIIGAFKSITTHCYIHGIKNSHWAAFRNTLWQRNYYEHIIRSETQLRKIRDYVENNPKTWESDGLFT